jgi:CheY-like chemotaxis protein
LKKILVIEDDLGIKDNLADLLELNNYCVNTLSDGARAVVKAIEFRPNLIICDIRMMPCDGWTVFEALKANPVTTTIPFMFLSAAIDRDVWLRAQSMNVEFLRKPFSQSQLLDCVQKLCS